MPSGRLECIFVDIYAKHSNVTRHPNFLQGALKCFVGLKKSLCWCNIMICHQFPVHIMGIHKWNAHLCMLQGCAVHHLTCIVQSRVPTEIRPGAYICLCRVVECQNKSQCHTWALNLSAAPLGHGPRI